MTALSRLFGGGSAGVVVPRAGVQNPAVPLTNTVLVDWLGMGTRTAAGVYVDEVSSLGIPAVYRSVTLVSQAAAALPLHAVKADGPIRVPQTSGEAAALLANPHPDLTSVELWELVYWSLLLWGNAYLRCVRNGAGKISELWYLPPTSVRPYRADADKVPTEYAYMGSKRYEVEGYDYRMFDAHKGGQVLHIPGPGYDGTCGLSVIGLARQALGLSVAAEQYGARLFGSGNLATGILTSDQVIDQEEADTLKSRWRAAGSGLESAHDVRVLGSGATFQQLSLPPEDSQFIESRRFQISEIARMFGIPPHMLGETEKATSWGTGIEQQNIGFVVYTLRPWLTRVEQRVSRILSPGPVGAKYAVEGLLRGDSAQRAAFYRAMWEVGAFSTNDILALEDRQPVEGGDTRYVPLNFGRLGEDPADPADPAVDPLVTEPPANPPADPATEE